MDLPATPWSNPLNCLGVDESLEEISGYFGPFRTPSSGLLIRVQLRDGGDHIGAAVEEVTHQSQLRALCRDGRERGLRLVGAFGGGEAGDQQ